MEVVQTITFTEEERDTLAKAFEIMVSMSDIVKDRSVYAICSWFCQYGLDYTDGMYIVPKCIQLDELYRSE